MALYAVDGMDLLPKISSWRDFDEKQSLRKWGFSQILHRDAIRSDNC